MPLARTAPQVTIDLDAWFGIHGREFPWRRPGRNLYELAVAELLLRKTRSGSVVGVWVDLTARYPSPSALAAASVEEVERLLWPLGLQRLRARQLIALAGAIAKIGEGTIDPEALARLPGLGRYGATAVSLLLGLDHGPAVDANVARIVARYFGLDIPVELHRAEHLWDAAADLVRGMPARDAFLALLDLGALVCKPRNPRCHDCPLAAGCTYGRDNRDGQVGDLGRR